MPRIPSLDPAIRAFLAVSFSGATIFLFVTGQAVPTELLGITLLINGTYFGPNRPEPSPAPAVEAPLPKPFTGLDE